MITNSLPGTGGTGQNAERGSLGLPKHVLIEHVFESTFRRVDPPIRVWVDVHRLLPRDAHDVYRNTPDGLNLEREVIGLVDGWAKRSDGGWLARVTYQLPLQDESGATELVTHYVPSHLVRRHSLVRRDRERSGLGH